MRHNPFGPPDYSWIFDYFDERPEEERARFLELVYKRMLDAHSPQEIALKILGADMPVEAAQKALGANTPVEAALKLVQTEEQRLQLLARLQQMAPQTAHAAAGA